MQFKQRMHVNWNLQIIYGYHFLIRLSRTLFFFAIINFHICKILVQKWKHGIGPNDIISYNEKLKFNASSIIELININDSSHEEAIVIFITNKDFNKTKNSYVTEDDEVNCS